MKNKYEKWYNNIIHNAKHRVLKPKYSEKHHILPRSMGGANDNDNIVTLSLREHIICHLLLTKFTTGQQKFKMMFAYGMMIGRTKDATCVTTTKAALNRANLFIIESNKRQERTKQWRDNLAKSKMGTKLSDSTKSKIRNSVLFTFGQMSVVEKYEKFGKSNQKRTKDGKEYISAEGRKNIAKGLSASLAIFNPNRKKWILISPNNIEYETYNLQDFCRTHGLKEVSLKNTLKTRKPISRGTSAGWQIFKGFEDYT